MAGINFGRLAGGSPADEATEPRRIFTGLPSKHRRYAYPRDVQAEVWDQWHARRDERDIVVKMNTGGGKTVVGLMMLKSSINESAGPAVYVSPDPYLAEQVSEEARSLGLETTDDPNSPRFQAGRAILVTSIYRLVNGRSVFGVRGGTRRNIAVGTVLIDDVHACLATLQQQFTLSIPNTHGAYMKLREVFAGDLNHQSQSRYRDLLDGDYATVLEIPYWSWFDHQKEILEILHPHRNEDELGFVWPLIAECLPFSRVAISAEAIEIRPPCPPIDRIPSFVNAKRRVYLTATLPDDSILVTHFAADPESVAKPITPRTADDLGDRMILTPVGTHQGANEENIRELLHARSADVNIVVIVPSWRRAGLWQQYAAAVHDSKTLQQGVAALRDGHVGLVVLVNKYDGIDLPGDACQILVLDGLPEAIGPLDRAAATALGDSEALASRQMQRIEQGMGRGVRSNDDYCVVLLLGASLISRLNAPGADAMLSPATLAQLNLSRRVAELLHNTTLEAMNEAIDRCLQRDTDWVTAAREALDGVTYAEPRSVRSLALAERQAFDLAERGQFLEAGQTLRRACDEIDDLQARGWFKQQAAAYLHGANPVQAQSLQASAKSDNRTVLKPRDGIAYHPARSSSDQAESCSSLLKSRYKDGSSLVVGLAAITESLEWSPDPASVPIFEQAFRDLGRHLGFEAERPELETGEGPDVLWPLGDLKFLAIECKSGAVTNFISKSDASQLSQAIDWFESKYGRDCEPTPVMVHPSRILGEGAFPREGMRVVANGKLTALKESVTKFASAIAQQDSYRDPSALGPLLAEFGLNGRAILDRWTVAPRRER